MKKLAVAALVVLMVGAAWADANVNASVEAVTISLTDLDLNDGVQPTLTVVWAQVTSDLGVESSGFEQQTLYNALPGFIPSFNQLAQGLVTAAATIGAVGTQQSLTLDAGGVLRLSSGPSVASLFSIADSLAQFTLSPSTRIDVTVSATAAVQADSPVGGSLSSLRSGAWLQVTGAGSSIEFDQIQLETIQSSAPLIDMREARTLRASFTNNSLGAVDVEIRVGSEGVGRYAATVPEPGPHALWLCGVLMTVGVGVWRARRRARVASAF